MSKEDVRIINLCRQLSLIRQELLFSMCLTKENSDLVLVKLAETLKKEIEYQKQFLEYYS